VGGEIEVIEVESPIVSISSPTSTNVMHF